MMPIHSFKLPRRLVLAAFAGAAALAVGGCSPAGSTGQPLRLDYAYYSPPSLVLKHFGWAEEAFSGDGVEVQWVLSAGSNRALQYLNSGGVDFASTAGLAAVLSRANGNPVKAVYVYSRPEWTALVVAKDSQIHSVGDLKGKKVAATKGTDPYLFLLRTLRDAGLAASDVEHVGVQHADGRTALEAGHVDAWAGLDPLMAASELDSGSKLIHRNLAYNTYGFLNVSEAFAAAHPDQVRKVIALYERARAWIIEHPEAAADILAREAGISPAVAELQLSRNDFSTPVPGAEHVAALKEAGPLLVEEGLVKPGTDVDRAIEALVDPSFALAAVH